ncbi:MAG: MotA/TolQ/ExbB proton channel family protein, partial [Flavobacteriales bacterium]
MNFLIFLQESISPLADSLATAGNTGMHPVGHFSIMEQLMKGWYIYLPQLLMSVIAVYVIIERTLTVNRADKEEASFMQRIKEYINQGKLDSAKNLCSTSGTPTARMIEKGISRIGKPVEDIKKAIEMVGKLETAKLDRNVSILATIAGIAPVFGFLGTVFGVIVIFRDIAEAGSLQIGTVSEGLYLKMISSAVGLIVFMIAYIGYNHLVTRVNKVV